MGLDFMRWLRGKLGGAAARAAAQEIAMDCCGLSAQAYVRELAFWSCVNLVGNALSKCEFKTFAQGKETFGPEYYLWNYAPNKNQSSSDFLHRLIARLYRDNEALVVEQGGQLLVADSFSRREYALYDDLFSDVQVGDFVFSRSFRQPEVLYFRLSEARMRLVVDGMCEVYQQLIDYGMKSYQKSRGSKGILKISTMSAGDPEFQKRYAELKNQNFKSFAEAENAVLPLFEGFDYTDLGSKTYANEGTRDIRAMIDDVSDFTAKAFGIPPALLSGEVEGTAEALEQFLTFCVDPLADLLGEEINRKRYGLSGLQQGYRIQIDTRAIKHVDLLSVSAAVDKLISSGAFCINDIRRLTGEPEIEEPWANQHFMTKNYAAVSGLLNPLGSGE